MGFRRLYWRVSIGGLALLTVMMAGVAALGGAPLELFYFAYFWIMLAVVIGLLALAFTVARRTFRSVRRGASPS